ncbi:hypothetical protein [Escherichia coli]
MTPEEKAQLEAAKQNADTLKEEAKQCRAGVAGYRCGER